MIIIEENITDVTVQLPQHINWNVDGDMIRVIGHTDEKRNAIKFWISVEAAKKLTNRST